MKKILLLAAIFLAALPLTFAQWQPGLGTVVQVTDMSPEGSPIRGGGSVSVHTHMSRKIVQTQWDIHVIATNISSKPIIAYEYQLFTAANFGGGVNHIKRRDDFFRGDSLLMPGSEDLDSYALPGTACMAREPRALLLNDAAPNSQNLEQNGPPETECTGGPYFALLSNVVPGSPPKVSVTVVFVEFADGTTFGKSDWGNNLIGSRRTMLELMQTLMRAYDGSENSLSAAINSAFGLKNLSPETYAELNRIKQIMDKQGPGSALTESKKCLDAAEEHKDIM